MAGRPRTTLRKLEGLLTRLLALRNDLDAMMPDRYRASAEDSQRLDGDADDLAGRRNGQIADCLRALGWQWCRDSLDNAATDFEWLVQVLQERVAAAEGTAPSCPAESPADNGESANRARRGAGANRRQTDRATLRRELQAMSLWPGFFRRLVELQDASGTTLDGAWQTAESEFACRVRPNARRDPGRKERTDAVERNRAQDGPKRHESATERDDAAFDPWTMPLYIVAELVWMHDNIAKPDVAPADTPNEFAACGLEGFRDTPSLVQEPWRIFADQKDEAERFLTACRDRLDGATLPAV